MPEHEFTTDTIVILGAGGDLVDRLLLPGLASLLATAPGYAPELIGVERDGDADAWRDRVRAALAEAEGLDGARIDEVADRTGHRRLDVLDREGLVGLVESLPADSLLYFALPPAVALEAVELLDGAAAPDGLRLALEKPIGEDEASARALNAAVARLVPEERVFRVDHFVGDSLVRNLLALRFANRVLEPVWNRDHVERVEIVADETIGLEGRGAFYDATGALVDMVQSHLLLVAALVAMDEPNAIDHVELRDLVAHALRATRILGDDPVAASRRARYTAGRVDGEELPDYVDEPDVDPANRTETLAEVVLEVRSQRWAGVPFVLRSGKALDEKRKLVRLHWRRPPVVPRGLEGDPGANALEVDLGTGGIRLELTTSGAGDPRILEPRALTGRVGEPARTPYGEVLGAMLAGDPLLSVRGDVAERCWAILQPVSDAWRADEVPLDEYAAGSAGPEGWAPLPR